MPHALLTSTSSLNSGDLSWDESEVPIDVFKGSKTITGLSNVKSLEDAMVNKFGMQASDLLSRREQILMYRRIESAFEKRIALLIRAGRYEEVKVKRQILGRIREQFERLQEDERRCLHEKQQRSFDLGKKVALMKLRAQHQKDMQAVEEVCHKRESYIAKKHAFQSDNVEREISAAIIPRMKNSTRLQYLKCAEKNLARLKQYDDAKNVYNMITKLEPVEIKKHNQKFQESLQAKREKMSANQESEKQRLSELTTSIRWKGIREREAGRHVTEQRTKNLYWDMQHAHKMEDHQHVELAIYPSMLLQKRPGYKYTGSGLRGSQFLDKVNGKTDVEAVYVHTLTDVHDFDKPLSGTVDLVPETD